MKYFLLLPLWFIMEVLGKILWPILPIFAKERYGPLDNNNDNGYEPRLPTWLSWFDTPDNSLYGDTGWRTIHCVDKWNTYWGMALWLFRNSSTGFSRSVLMREVLKSDLKTEGDPFISADKGIFGTFKANNGKGVWQYKKVFPTPFKNIGFNFGWNIDPLVKNKDNSMKCHYKVSIKLKDIIKDK